MKTLLVALIASYALGNSVSFICESPTSRFNDFFVAEGILDSQNLSRAKESRDFSGTLLLKPRAIKFSPLLIENINQKANVKLISNISNKEFVYLNAKLKAKGTPYELKLLVDFPGKFNSTVTNLNSGQKFRASCKSIEIKK